MLGFSALLRAVLSCAALRCAAQTCLSRQRSLAATDIVVCMHVASCADPRRFLACLESLSYADYSMAIKSGVHFTLCGGTVAKLGTAKHHESILPKLNTLELTGCFGMTELGHGSNVMGIETTVRVPAMRFSTRVVQWLLAVAHAAWFQGAHTAPACASVSLHSAHARLWPWHSTCSIVQTLVCCVHVHAGCI